VTRPGGRGEWPPFAPGSFLSQLSPSVLEELLAGGRQRTFRPAERLLREGGTDTHMFLLLRGFVKITAVLDGTETLLAIRVPGDFLGEVGAISGRPRIATVTACGRVLTVVRTQPAVQAFLHNNPDAAAKMTAAVSQRLHWANLRRADFFTYSVELRLARVLLALSGTCGRRTDAGILIDVQLTQAELASMIGAGEATVQKAIRSLRERGVIHTGYRRITIVDAAELRRMSDAESND
jgi:CRP/FNR family cyclic AMP-dependent transcriptional regulator